MTTPTPANPPVEDTPQHAAGCAFDPAKDEPGVGFGLAGGGYGAYSYCPVCGVILDKVQERDA